MQNCAVKADGHALDTATCRFRLACAGQAKAPRTEKFQQHDAPQWHICAGLISYVAGMWVR